MKTNIIKDLSVLTTISDQTLIKLFNKINWCAADAVEASILNKEDTTELDLEIGTLTITVSNSEIKYHFRPSEKFEKDITNTVLNERNVLTKNIESSLVSKVMNTYKNFF